MREALSGTVTQLRMPPKSRKVSAGPPGGTPPSSPVQQLDERSAKLLAIVIPAAGHRLASSVMLRTITTNPPRGADMALSSSAALLTVSAGASDWAAAHATRSQAACRWAAGGSAVWPSGGRAWRISMQSRTSAHTKGLREAIRATRGGRGAPPATDGFCQYRVECLCCKTDSTRAYSRG